MPFYGGRQSRIENRKADDLSYASSARLTSHDQAYVVASRRTDDVIPASMGTARADELITTLPRAHGSRE